ncbi:secreted ookinete protein, putative [Hepatocystis sp. ex Piliocolobus tephrosceles]|nr:secreted ookinete protein, putative [Hepatocystis sp. ex Piliocolobus tephrosceles]
MKNILLKVVFCCIFQSLLVKRANGEQVNITDHTSPIFRHNNSKKSDSYNLKKKTNSINMYYNYNDGQINDKSTNLDNPQVEKKHNTEYNVLDDDKSQNIEALMPLDKDDIYITSEKKDELVSKQENSNTGTQLLNTNDKKVHKPPLKITYVVDNETNKTIINLDKCNGSFGLDGKCSIKTKDLNSSDKSRDDINLLELDNNLNDEIDIDIENGSEDEPKHTSIEQSQHKLDIKLNTNFDTKPVADTKSHESFDKSYNDFMSYNFIGDFIIDLLSNTNLFTNSNKKIIICNKKLNNKMADENVAKPCNNSCWSFSLNIPLNVHKSIIKEYCLNAQKYLEKTDMSFLHLNSLQNDIKNVDNNQFSGNNNNNDTTDDTGDGDKVKNNNSNEDEAENYNDDEEETNDENSSNTKDLSNNSSDVLDNLKNNITKEKKSEKKNLATFDNNETIKEIVNNKHSILTKENNIIKNARKLYNLNLYNCSYINDWDLNKEYVNEQGKLVKLSGYVFENLLNSNSMPTSNISDWKLKGACEYDNYVCGALPYMNNMYSRGERILFDGRIYEATVDAFENPKESDTMWIERTDDCFNF